MNEASERLSVELCGIRVKKIYYTNNLKPYLTTVRGVIWDPCKRNCHYTNDLKPFLISVRGVVWDPCCRNYRSASCVSLPHFWRTFLQSYPRGTVVHSGGEPNMSVQ